VQLVGQLGLILGQPSGDDTCGEHGWPDGGDRRPTTHQKAPMAVSAGGQDGVDGGRALL
jgi:hypothetical protein